MRILQCAHVLLSVLSFLALSDCRIVGRTNNRVGARQEFHNELVRLEELARTRLPWNLNDADHLERLKLRTANGLKVRDDDEPPFELTGDQTSMVLNLWENTRFKVPVNNMFVKYDITTDNSIVMTTYSCYGCTAVVMCSAPGKLCIFAHFRQENGGKKDTWPKGQSQDVAFAIHVLEPINEAIKLYKDPLVLGGPLCIIFSPGISVPPRSFIYPWRIKGEGSINEAITDAFPSASILNIGYNYPTSKGDWGDDWGWGKLVLEWVGGASSCANGGSSLLNVFAEENWWRSLRFDDDGNPVTVDKTPCQSPVGSQDGFDGDVEL
ncbi:uncharacterized protein LY89DRAFT_674960 [Mollisia scopiformis]|uniref:Uncharacterized protein n=1 Tax=Mollisia scopiformis TaxID=149040 RepID=A0A194WT53_MOLSC|nr:uncharacterized protein LY89DRAFT_674960 [Mollisia scopiformis]KUJ10849.1 hypothetical protein LY89DRAFT_674960 [Mollisia scopiformis]